MSGGYSLGKGYAKVRFDTSDIDFEGFGYRAKKAIKTYFEQEAAPSVRQYMKNNHKWKNRTHTAEVGLEAKVVTDGNMKRDDWRINLAMYHTALHNGYEYGLVLEGLAPLHGVYRKDLGVLEDTVKLYTPVVLRDMAGILDRYGGV